MGRIITNSQLACLWIGIGALLMLLGVIQNREFAGALETSPIAMTMPAAVEIVQAWSGTMEAHGVNERIDGLRGKWKSALGMEF